LPQRGVACLASKSTGLRWREPLSILQHKKDVANSSLFCHDWGWLPSASSERPDQQI
jgi:hypothetical protein